MVCVSTGAAALVEAGRDDFGIVISGYSLPDMYYKQLSDCLPRYYQLLFVGKPEMLQDGDSGILALSVPVRVSDLINTVSMMLSQLQRSRKKDQKKPKKGHGRRKIIYAMQSSCSWSGIIFPRRKLTAIYRSAVWIMGRIWLRRPR